jgi:MarR family transcriptional regulator, 2-MHQ and catechol-resistance regulon repressor
MNTRDNPNPNSSPSPSPNPSPNPNPGPGSGPGSKSSAGAPLGSKGVHAWLILWKAYRMVESLAVRSIESLSMCTSDFGVLEVLLNKGPLPVNTIGKKILLTSGSSTTLIDRLEKRRFVERFDDPSDRRVRLVRLTASGRAFIEEAFARHETHMNDAVSHLTAEELTTLIQLLKKLGYGAEARLKQSPEEAI